MSSELPDLKLNCPSLTTLRTRAQCPPPNRAAQASESVLKKAGIYSNRVETHSRSLCALHQNRLTVWRLVVHQPTRVEGGEGVDRKHNHCSVEDVCGLHDQRSACISEPGEGQKRPLRTEPLFGVSYDAIPAVSELNATVDRSVEKKKVA